MCRWIARESPGVQGTVSLAIREKEKRKRKRTRTRKKKREEKRKRKREGVCVCVTNDMVCYGVAWSAGRWWSGGC